MSVVNVKTKLVEMLRTLDDFIYERVGPTRILFVTTDNNGFLCQAPVIAALKENADTRVRVTTINTQYRLEMNFLSSTESKLFSECQISAKIAALSKWHIVVYSHMCSFYPRRHVLRAYMHHGPGFGSGGGTHAAEMCDIYFGLSEAERLYLEAKCPKLFGDNKAYFSVGFPKSDAILNGEYKRKDVLSKYGLQDRKTLLIASRWNSFGLLQTLQEAPFRMLASSFPEWNVIQTGHPWLWESREGIDPKWQSTLIDALHAVEKGYPNAYFIPSVPAEPLAAASDLLVADGSSIVTTFSLLDRPIVYFDNPDRAEESKRPWAAYRDAGYTFTSLSELTKTCRIAMEDASPVHRKARGMLKEQFFTNSGCASDVMANILTRMGRTCSKDSPGWAHIIDLSREYAAGQSPIKDA